MKLLLILIPLYLNSPGCSSQKPHFLTSLSMYKNVKIFQFEKSRLQKFANKEINNLHNSLMLGLFINDTNYIRPEWNNKDVTSCPTAMLEKIEKNEFKDVSYIENLQTFDTTGFQGLNNITWTSPKQKLVLLYINSLNQHFKKFFLKCQKLCSKKDIEMYILYINQ